MMGPRDERAGAASEEAERGIAAARTALARTEEGRKVEITDDCRDRFTRWFDKPEK